MTFVPISLSFIFPCYGLFLDLWQVSNQIDQFVQYNPASAIHGRSDRQAARLSCWSKFPRDMPFRSNSKICPILHDAAAWVTKEIISLMKHRLGSHFPRTFRNWEIYLTGGLPEWDSDPVIAKFLGTHMISERIQWLNSIWSLNLNSLSVSIDADQMCLKSKCEAVSRQIRGFRVKHDSS
jgi:hypothetical protein